MCFKIISIVCSTFFLLSCVEDIDIDVEQLDSQFVIGGLFSNTDEFEIYIGQSQSITDTIFNIQDDVEAVISYNGISDTLIRDEDDDEGWYYSENLIPQTGVTYYLTVNGDNKDTVTASDYIPNPVSFEITDFNSKAGADDYGEYYASANITFSDSLDTDDYYMVLAEGNYDSYYLYSDDILVNGDDLTNEYSEDHDHFIFSDKLFNGEKVSISFYINDFNNYTEYKSDTLNIYLCHLTEDYYNYLTTSDLHFTNQETDIWDGSGNPIEMYTNISNGYGVFAGCNKTSNTIDVE